MKIIFVIPNWKRHDIKYTTVSLHIPNSMPLEFLYVQTMLKESIDTEIIDANLLDIDFEELRERIIASHAEVMVFNTTINYILWRCPPVDFEIPKQLMKICKDLSIRTIAIGPHSSVDPEEVYRELGVDYLISGEPEIALADFLNSELKNTSIKGLYGKGIDNGIASEVDITKLALPDFKNINLLDYDIHAWSKNTISNLKKEGVRGTILEYSRGCIFHCPYCFRKNFRNNYRKKHISQIEKEIQKIKSMGIKYIYFIDEIFNIDNKEWRSLLRILKREKILFGCQARPDTMTYEMIDRMKDAGCVYVEYGVESFSKDVLKTLNKNLDKQRLLRIIAYSYQVFGKENVELGMINFYINDIMEILNLTSCESWNAKVVRPYPDSSIGDALFLKYNVNKDKWDFLLRYIWWSQIENYQNYLDLPHDMSIKNLILYGDYMVSKEKSYELISKYMEKAKAKSQKG